MALAKGKPNEDLSRSAERSVREANRMRGPTIRDILTRRDARGEISNRRGEPESACPTAEAPCGWAPPGVRG